MRLPTKRERILLALVPAVILVAAGAEQESKEQPATVAEAKPASGTRSNAGSPSDAGELDLAQLRREADAGEPVNVFTSKSWYVPPPPPPPPPPPVKVAPAPPTAPPLPFTFLGRYADGDKPVFFLVKGDRVLTVKEGDIIDGNYRVDGIAGSTLGLTYLPLNIKQTLDIGGAG
jgi:hypothetical protein